MRNWWLRFGCFLTGINYPILQSCSEVSKKQVKKYTSAMIIVMLIWAFVGYTFTQRYLQAGLVGSLAGAAVMIVIIVQIERQIILTVGKLGTVFTFRVVIAILMAILGSAILDQIIFKNDIELEQVVMVNERVNAALPGKTAELRSQIRAFDSTISEKDAERRQLMDEIALHPTIKAVTDQSVPLALSNTTTDSNNVTRTTSRVVHSSSRTVTSIPNPKMELIPPIDAQIESLRIRKAELDNQLLNARKSLEEEIKSKTGFLDELTVMVRLLGKSGVALGFYLILLLFLLGLELFVVFTKRGGASLDYDEKIIQSQAIHKRKLQALN